MLNACYVSKFCVNTATGDYIWGRYYFLDADAPPAPPNCPAGCSVWGDDYDRGFHLIGDTFDGYVYDNGVWKSPPCNPDETAWPSLMSLASLGNIVNYGGTDYTLSTISVAPRKDLTYRADLFFPPGARRVFIPMRDACMNYSGIHVEVDYSLGVLPVYLRLAFDVPIYPWYVQNSQLLPEPVLPAGFTWTHYGGFVAAPAFT